MSDNDDKHDLTRLEDLSEYVHELNNSEIDSQLEDSTQVSDTPPPAPPALDLDELEESPTPATPDDFEIEDINQDSDESEVDDLEDGTVDYSSDDFEDATVTDFSDPTEPDFQLSSSDISSEESFNNSQFEENSDFSTNDENFAEGDSFSSEDEFDSSDFNNNNDDDDDDDDDFSNEVTEEDEQEDEGAIDFSNEEVEPESEENITEDHEDVNDQQDSYETESSNNQYSSAQSTYTPPETFKDVRQFAHHISYGQVTRGGVPPYTLLIKDINYKDDVDDIKIILREYGLYNDDSASLIDQSLSNGTLILPQLSEFTAVFLANKLRRFSGDIQLGLSEEVHPSKGVNKQFKGLVSKENLLRNTKVSKNLVVEATTKDSIIVSTTPTISGQTIVDYLGIVTADVIVPEKFFEDENIQTTDAPEQNTDILSNFTVGSSAYYQQLVEQIKSKALELKASAVVGLTYAVTPLVNYQDGEKISSSYKIITTGSAVTLVSAKENQEK